MYKILVIGDSSVGKTSLIDRFVNNSFKDNYRPTIVCEFGVKVLNVNGVMMRVQLWDIGGQEHLGGISKIFCKDAIGCAIVCDVSRKITLAQYFYFYLFLVPHNGKRKLIQLLLFRIIHRSR